MTFFQRVADITLVLISAPFVLPVAILLAVLIRMSGPGPVLLKLDVIDADGHVFGQYRFRSVFMDARARRFEAQMVGEGTCLTCQTTAVGRFMIETGLNALPQLLNVLKADMSLFAKSDVLALRVATSSSRGQ